MARVLLIAVALTGCAAAAPPVSPTSIGEAPTDAHATVATDGVRNGAWDGTEAPEDDSAAERTSVEVVPAIALEARCPREMALVAGRVCVDRYEASVEEVLPDGDARPWSPHHSPVDVTV